MILFGEMVKTTSVVGLEGSPITSGEYGMLIQEAVSSTYDVERATSRALSEADAFLLAGKKEGKEEGVLYAEALFGEGGILSKIFKAIADAFAKVANWVKGIFRKITGDTAGKIESIKKTINEIGMTEAGAAYAKNGTLSLGATDKIELPTNIKLATYDMAIQKLWSVDNIELVVFGTTKTTKDIFAAVQTMTDEMKDAAKADATGATNTALTAEYNAMMGSKGVLNDSDGRKQAFIKGISFVKDDIVKRAVPADKDSDVKGAFIKNFFPEVMMKTYSGTEAKTALEGLGITVLFSEAGKEASVKTLNEIKKQIEQGEQFFTGITKNYEVIARTFSNKQSSNTDNAVVANLVNVAKHTSTFATRVATYAIDLYSAADIITMKFFDMEADYLNRTLALVKSAKVVA